jgi:hypothetical protein
MNRSINIYLSVSILFGLLLSACHSSDDQRPGSLPDSVTNKPQANNKQETKSMKMTKGGMMAMVHNAHIPVELPEMALMPKLDLSIYPDSMSGFNLHIEYQHFENEPPEFADIKNEKNMSEKNIVDGHAHLFINGEKVQRVYGRYLHLQAKYFKPGINQVTITLNDHQHNHWSRNNKRVFASYFIDTEKSPMVQHYMTTSAVQ